MLVFDAHAYVRYDGKHSRMIIRHVVLVAPKTGRLTTFVWLLGSDGKGVMPGPRPPYSLCRRHSMKTAS